MSKIIAALMLVPLVVAGCSTGSVVWENETATATAEAVTAKAARQKVQEMLSEVCQPSSDPELMLDLDLATDALKFVDTLLGMSRRHSVTIVRANCELREQEGG